MEPAIPEAEMSAERFEAACMAWRAKFGLLDWAFRFKVEEGDDTRCAVVDMDHDAREAIFTYYTKGEQPEAPERLACHEVLHVVFVELLEVAVLRCHVEHKDVEREEHRAIERLLNALDGRP
jgi:hypothetical protein